MSVWLTQLGLGASSATFGLLAIAVRPGPPVAAVPRLRLRLAALFMAAWALGTLFLLQQETFEPAIGILLSLAIVGIWAWQLEPIATWLGQPRAFRIGLSWSGLTAVAVATGWMGAAARFPEFPQPSVELLSILGLCLCVFGLFALEQIYRNSPEGVQPALRWLCLGAGAVILIGLIDFSETLLFGSMKTAAAGPLQSFTYALCALAMLRGAKQMPKWQMGISVSRQVAFYAGSFLLMGGLLVAMALIGWLVLTYASHWQAAAKVAFTLLAGAGLFLALFAGGIFRRLRVLIATHFYPHRYDYRREWIRFARTMYEDGQDSSVPERSIRALAQIIGSPGGTLWQVERRYGRFQAIARWPDELVEPLETIPEQHPLPAYLHRTSWLIDLAELRQTPGLYEDLQLDAATFRMAADSLIVPLVHVDVLWGWIILDRPASTAALDFEDRDLLKIAGRHAAAHLAQVASDAQLAEAGQFETYNRTAAFVMHDLKNIAAQLRLISQNAERHRHNPAFVDDSLQAVAAAASRMSRLISQLGTGRESGTIRSVNLAACAERAARRCSQHAPTPQLEISARPVVIADQDQLTGAIEHIVRNAQDATPPGGLVRITVDLQGTRPVLEVVDSGCGMDARFVRERLFRPFDTTKGPRGMGIGAFQVREFMRSVGGDVTVRSEPGRGTSLTMVFSGLRITAASNVIVAEGGAN